MKKTSLIIRESTKRKLSKFGTVLSSWDEVLCNLISHVEKCDTYWSDRL